jgi:hypothetical protein
MKETGTGDWAGRVLAVLAVLVFAGIPLWLGIALRHATVAAMQRPSPAKPARLPARAGALAITDGPRLELGTDGQAYVLWRTSEPADSLVTYGRSHPTEQVAATDARQLIEHRFALPEGSFAAFCRIRVMSAAKGGRAASGELGPGGGGKWDVFPEAGASYNAFRELASANAFVWGDYDGDGRPDMAICEERQGNDVVSVLSLPTAPGRQTKVEVARLNSGSCRRLHWADFNADGYPDLLVAGDRLVLCRNDGPPGWQVREAIVLAEGGAAAVGSAVADMNSDGLPDVLAVNAARQLVLYRNEGPPAYGFAAGQVIWQAPAAAPPAAPSTPERSAAGAAPETQAPADQGPGRIDRASTKVLIPADFTGDGQTDVCVLLGEAVLLVGGSGGYVPLERAFPPAAKRLGGDAWAEAADWDGDGHLDLYMSAGGGSEGGRLLCNDGVGRFADATGQAGELARLKGPVRCGAWADFDGSGYPDLVLSTQEGVRLYLNGGKGRFMDATDLCPLTPAARAEAIAISAPDFNGDCAPDLHVTLAGGRTLLLENRWWEPTAGAYLKVRPLGKLGVCGSHAFLLNEGTGAALASAIIAIGGAGPAENCFGVRWLDTADVKVVFTDKAARSAVWRKGKSPAPVVSVKRAPEAAP